MTDVENALRDALDARAAFVVPDPEAYERVVARRRRSFRLRVAATTGVVATAATAAVVLLTGVLAGIGPVVVGPAGSTGPAAPTGPVAAVRAPYLTGVTGDQVTTYDQATMRRASSYGVKDYRAVAVAAAGDGRTFYVASVSPVGCRSFMFKYRVEGSTVYANDLRGPAVAGQAVELALSPDGNRLAYVVRTAVLGSMEPCSGTELHVRDLRTGKDVTWQGSGVPGSLGWEQDNRSLVYAIGCCDVYTLDADGADRPYSEAPHVTPRPRLRRPHSGRSHCAMSTPTPRGRTGQLVGVVRCEDAAGPVASQFVMLLDPATGAVGDLLFTIYGNVQRLAFDPSGDHAYVETGPLPLLRTDPAVVLMRWDRGENVRRVDTGQDHPYRLAW